MYSKGRKLGMNIAGKLKKKLGDSDVKEQQGMPLLDVSSESAIGLNTESAGQKLSKSSSMGSINDSTVSERTIVNQDDIIVLTQGVKSFSDGLARLKAVFGECSESKEELRVQTHERLGEVLFILKNILHNYPALQSTELFAASGALISKVKNFDYGGTSTSAAELNFAEAIDQLALAFSSSVSEYLMGDIDSSFTEKDAKTKSCDNLLGNVNDKESEGKEEAPDQEVTMSPEDIDNLLCKLQAGVDIALQRAKAWSKYMKDITSYIEKKAQLETEYSKNLARLALTMKPVLTEEGFLPLQSVYCTVLSQDKDYASTCQATQTLLQSSKFVEPLMARRLEHDKMRKNIKDSWSKELKRMQDSVHSLRKAQSLYVTRQQEYEKAKEQAKKMESDMLSQSSSSSALNKVDKRRKMEEEAQHKAAEAETTYKACVAEANSRQQELGRTKTELLARIREQIYQCDQVIKAVTIEYFHLLHTVSTPIPIQYHTLSETTKQYDPGVQYREFVRRLPVGASKQTNTEPFVFESFVSYSAREVDTRKTSTQSTGSASSGAHSQEGSPQPTSPWKDRSRVPPVAAWSQGMVAGSDTDSASGSSKSLESSPNNSPHPTGHRRLVQTGSLDDLDEVNDLDKQRLIQQGLLPIPGSDVGDGLCLVKFQGDRRNTTFGVDFQEQVQHCHSAVPPIVIKCLQEIEKRGITFEGIYRKSGVKSKVEGLCRKFEKDPNSVDLDDEPPHVIANVLKLYLRQLPEPLLTFKLYSGFIRAARETASGNSEKQEIITSLSDIVTQLPYSNLKTCATLMYHLYRISSYCSINQMTAHNLGIIFGPTLLRPLEGTSSLASLVDMPYQTRAVELLITYVQDVFGPESEYELIPGETPVEQLANDKSSKKQHLAPSPPSPSSPLTDAKPSTDTKVQPQEQKPDSASSPEVVEQLIKGDQDDTEPKNSVADFVLPGSAQSDKKDSNSPTVTISDGDDSGDVQSDDDLPLLPDDSISPQSQQPPTMFCHQEGRGTIATPHINNKTNPLCDRDNLQGKPSPPQQLRLAVSEVMSPETARKMMVPTINIIDSSPVGDKSIQPGFAASRDQSKKLNQSWPSQSSKKSHQGKSSSDSGISLKSVGPSIQSFIMSTAKSIFSDSSKQGSSKSTNVANSSSNVNSEVSSAEQYEQINKNESSDKKSEVSLSVSVASPMSPRFTEVEDSIAKTPTPPTFSPQLCRQAARSSKEKPAVAPKPTPASIAASAAKDDVKSSQFLSRLASTAKPNNVSNSPVLTRFTPLRSDETISKTPVKTRSSPQLTRQAMVSDESSVRYSYTPSSEKADENQNSFSPRYSFTPQSPRFSPKPLRHAMSVQSSMSTGYGLHKTGPSPNLSRKSLSLTDHSGKSGRISPRPLSSPLLLRQSSTSPVFRSNQRESDSSQSSSDPLLSSSEHPGISRSSSQSSSDQHEFAFDMEGQSEDLTALFKTGMESRSRRSVCSLDRVEDEELKKTLPSSHGMVKEDSGKIVSEIASDEKSKQPKLTAFDSVKESHCSDKEFKTEGCEEKGEKIDSKFVHRDASFNITSTSNGTLKNHSNLKLSPREKFLLGLSNNEPPKTVKSVSFDLDPFESKDSDNIESKEELDDPNVVLKIIEENFAGKGNVEKNVNEEQRTSDISVVSGYVYEVSPTILSRSQPSVKSKSEQSSYSLSSQSSMSDIEDSSVTSSDVSPELSRSLISLPKSSKSVLSSSGFPDFSPILPRQKDTILKKHDSLPNLPPSSTFPLSGNLSTMTSVTSDTSNPQMPRTKADHRLGVSDPVSASSTDLFYLASTTVNTQHSKCTTFVSSPNVASCPADTVATPACVADTRPFMSPLATSSHSKSVVQRPESETVPGMTSSSVATDPNFSEALPDQSHKDQILAQLSSEEKSPPPKMIRSLPYTDLHILTKSVQVTGSLAKIISPLIAQTSGTLNYSEPNISAAMRQKTPLPQSSSVKDVGLANPQPLQSKIPVSPKVKRSGGFVTQTPSISSQQSMLQSTPTEEVLMMHGDAKITQANTPLNEQSSKASLVPSSTEQQAQNRPPQPPPKPTRVSPVSISPESSTSETANQMFAQRPQPIGGEYDSVTLQQTETSNLISEQPAHIVKEVDEDKSRSIEQMQGDATTKPEIVSTPSTPSPSMVSKTMSKDSKARPARTALQTTKSIMTRDPPKTAKGPSGIVMGKAAIMPGRGNRVTSAVGGRKSPAVVGSAASGRKSPAVVGSAASGRKSPAVGNTGVGGRKSPAVGSSTVSTTRRPSAGTLSSSTCGRKSPSVGSSSPAGGITSTSGRKSGGVSVSATAGGRRSPAVSNQQKTMSQGSGSPVGPSSRKSSLTSSTSASSSPKSSVSCSTCGRRKTSVGRTGSEPTQQVTLTSYRRTSATASSSEGQRSGSEGQKMPESKDSEAQSCKKKVPEKGHKIIVRSSGTRKERVPYFV